MNESNEQRSEAEQQEVQPTHVLNFVALSLGGGEGLPKKALGGAAHVTHGSAQALARKYTLNVLGQLPENPAASLSGATVPSADILTEKPEHRFVIYLNCQGHKPDEIATKTGYTVQHVRTIMAQPWARRQTIRMLEESNPRKMVEEMLEQGAVQSVQVLMAIRDDPKQPAAVRAKVCDALLDRYLGKAVQPISPARPVEADDEALNTRLAELKARESDLIGRPKVRDVHTGNLTLVDTNQPAA